MSEKREWTITAMHQAMLNDLQQCRTEFERQNCKAVNVADIIKAAKGIKNRRKLSPGEVSVLEHLGVAHRV